MALIQDSFTAANGTVLSSHTSESGATYARHASFTVATITIEDNRAVKDTDVATAVYYVNNITDPKFFEVEFTIIDKSDVNRSTGIEVGIDTGSDTGIIFRRQNATTWQLLKIIASTPSATLLSASETFSAEASHALKIRRIPETNDYECFLDNVSLGVVTISDVEFLGAGKIGIRATNSQGAGVGYHFDNLSVQSLSAPRTLHRGRNFPLFDDEDVNRFEFWPAIAVATVHERSVALSATAEIASSGESFSVFERTVAINATGAIVSSGLHVSERSIAIDSTATITVSGARVIERSLSFSATASIESSGISFTLFESTASLNATASIESSGISFSVFERSASLSASASIEVVGLRIVERSLSFSVTAVIESAGTFFSVVNSTAQFDATATIESSAEFFSILERQSVVNSVAAIAATRQVELMRSVVISTVADIAVSGGIEGGVFEHERSAAINATGAIESSAISFSIVERASTISAIAIIVTSAQRDLQRSVAIDATAEIGSAGALGVEPIERAASFSAVATITVSGMIFSLPPLSRTFVVELGRYEVEVGTGNYEFMVDAGDYEEDSELQST